jgi:hypothetical protein
MSRLIEAGDYVRSFFPPGFTDTAALTVITVSGLLLLVH